MSRKILFLDRDGTLIDEPEDGKVDSLDKLALVSGVIPALLRLKRADYEFVIVSNQDGLGTEQFPQQCFDAPNRAMLELFASQGIEFAAVLFCPHYATEQCDCRKPQLGLLHDFIADPSLDHKLSAVVGDRDSDIALAKNLGLTGFKIEVNLTDGLSWADIVHQLVDRPRIATVQRDTRETNVRVDVDLDRESDAQIETGIGFFDHMLEQLGKHGGFALSVQCSGDLEVDQHHTVEDVALTLGQALKEALGEKRGVQRYGFILPMDEARAEVAIDIGGRPYLVFEGEFPSEQLGILPTELVPHFFRSLADALGASIQIRVRGDNTHHMVEACFKSVARTLRQACLRVGDELPTTKGRL